MLSRVLLGATIAMQVALAAVSVAFLIGVPWVPFPDTWAVSRYRRDEMIDALLAFPGRLLAIALVAATGTSFLTLCVAIGVNAIPGYTRVVRAAVLVQKEKEYVEAARMSGESGPGFCSGDLSQLFGAVVGPGDP